MYGNPSNPDSKVPTVENYAQTILRSEAETAMDLLLTATVVTLICMD